MKGDVRMEADRRRDSGSLTERVVAHISSLIKSGSLAPGERLPPESEIVRQQRVSRTVVREAISRLQATGLLVTRHGIGSFVRIRTEREDFGLDRKQEDVAGDVLAVLELRIGLETEAAGLAALRRTNDHLGTLKRAMQACAVEMQTGGAAVDPDFQFHLGVAKAAGNRYFVDILSTLGAKAIPRFRIEIDQRELERQEYLKRTINEHEDIFSAIRRGDMEASRAAMRNHLSNSRERMRHAIELHQAADAKN